MGIMDNKADKVKATILIDRTLKKLAQVHAIQNDMSFGELIEKALRSEIVGK
jgi:hypothetical protein